LKHHLNNVVDCPGAAMLSQVRERRETWRWEYMKQRRLDKMTYIKLYKKIKKRKPLSETEQNQLKALETKLSFEDILLYSFSKSFSHFHFHFHFLSFSLFFFDSFSFSLSLISLHIHNNSHHCCTSAFER
jgi:hypothetical protein